MDDLSEKELEELTSAADLFGKQLEELGGKIGKSPLEAVKQALDRQRLQVDEAVNRLMTPPTALLQQAFEPARQLQMAVLKTFELSSRRGIEFVTRVSEDPRFYLASAVLADGDKKKIARCQTLLLRKMESESVVLAYPSDTWPPPLRGKSGRPVRGKRGQELYDWKSMPHLIILGETITYEHIMAISDDTIPQYGITGDKTLGQVNDDVIRIISLLHGRVTRNQLREIEHRRETHVQNPDDPEELEGLYGSVNGDNEYFWKTEVLADVEQFVRGKHRKDFADNILVVAELGANQGDLRNASEDLGLSRSTVHACKKVLREEWLPEYYSRRV